MGRVKLRIKRLESLSNRQVTYSKRRNGLLKKAKELSILCDIDICLLMFSPSGKPTLFRGERSSLEEIISKFAQLTPQERAKRKLECLEALKKTFKKEGHDVKIHEFLGPSAQTVEELNDHVKALQSQLSEVHRRLSCWSDPDKIDNIQQLKQMEDSLKESLHQISAAKENFQKQQVIPLECPSQFPNGMHLPMLMSSMQEGPPLAWIPHSENQHMQNLLLQQDPSFLPQRDMECSTAASFPGYSGYVDTSGQTGIGNIGQISSAGQERVDFNQFSRPVDLSLELSEQFYTPYGHLNIADGKKLKRQPETSLQGNHMPYQISSNFELNRPFYDNGHHAYISASGPCALSMFNGNPYPQQQN